MIRPTGIKELGLRAFRLLSKTKPNLKFKPKLKPPTSIKSSIGPFTGIGAMPFLFNPGGLDGGFAERYSYSRSSHWDVEAFVEGLDGGSTNGWSVVASPLTVIQVMSVVQVLTKVSPMGGLVPKISAGVAVGYGPMSSSGTASMLTVVQVTPEISAFSSAVGRHSEGRNYKPAKSLLQCGFLNSLPTSVAKDLSSTSDNHHSPSVESSGVS
jgi:hypothetical protein